MIRRPASLFLFILFTGSRVWSADAVNFLISIHQTRPDSQERILVYSDSTVAIKGESTSGFLTGFSLDLSVTGLDTIAVEFNVHIVTLNSNGKTLAKRFKTEYGVPAIVNDIEAKKGSLYSLTLVPQNYFQISDRDCHYDHNTGTDFTIFPSANFDLHFLRSSLASYHATALKGLFETEYRLFRGIFHFSQTGKPGLFLFPCEVSSVIWDKRFGTALDPTRNNCYALYTTGLNTSDPFILIHEAILRNYGYAPPFLTEGLANYFSLAIHTMKKVQKKRELIPLNQLLNTKVYLTSDPTTADASSSTFVRYLIDRYSPEEFMNMYSKADDLNLTSIIESTYAKPVVELEQEWLHYIDTLTVPGQVYSQFADRATQMWNYPLALEYRQMSLGLAANQVDSLQRLEELAGAYFLMGDYFNAAASQELFSKIDSKDPEHLLGLAGYRMMNGEYDSARRDLMAFWNSDSTNEVLKFNLALNSLLQGDSIRAIQFWSEIVNNVTGGQFSGEARTMLALVMNHSRRAEDRGKAKDLLTVAMALFSQQLQTDPSLPNPHMWTGIALVGLSEGDNAYDQLNHALFLENRPFYIGMINLWLGKAADLRGKRELARQHYSEVIAVNAAAYHQDEAQKFLKSPYAP